MTIATAVLALPTAGRAADLSLAVNASASRHAINPNVYGMNFASPSDADAIRLPVDRWGGNAVEMYNFKLGAVNTAADYFYENIADCFYFGDQGCGNGNTPYYKTFVARDVARQTKPLITLPMAGYVAKDAPTKHPFTCGFPSGGPSDPYDSGCFRGDGVTSVPTRDGVAVTDADRAAWVKDLASRGVHLYELGNEPMLWNSTHRDIHPQPTTYDELKAKSIALAKIVKANDSSAKVLGFSEWGWPNYFCSAADDTSDGCQATDSDRAAHGGKELVRWYLQQMHDASAAAHRRLLDFLDVHYYTQGRDPNHPTDVTRSLYDPNYVDPSYIDDKIDLLPRMSDWIADDYPGIGRALSEYDLTQPNGGDLNAIIEADTLGILGREGVDLATYFDEGYSPAGTILTAFRMFRNYDAKHGSFGSTSVKATSGDQTRLAVYAAERSDGALTVLVINKATTTLSATLSLAGGSGATRAGVYRWTGGTAIKRVGSATLGPAVRYPARSMTLFVVPGFTAG